MLKEILSKLKAKNVALVAVSKRQPNIKIQDFYDQGQRVFGENYVQELVTKQAALPKDIDWHFIGHLQRNKVKEIASFVAMIHGVDSLRLLQEIDKRAKQHERKIDCLLQFHIAEEATKMGLDLASAKQLLASNDFDSLQNINIRGVMGMATFTADREQVRREFQQLKAIFGSLKTNYFSEKKDFGIISMGMSGDYELAIEEGSTMVRIGSLLFGQRA